MEANKRAARPEPFVLLLGECGRGLEMWGTIKTLSRIGRQMSVSWHCMRAYHCGARLDKSIGRPGKVPIASLCEIDDIVAINGDLGSGP